MAATTSNVALNQYDVAVSGGTTPSNLFIRDVPDWTKLLRRTDVPLLKAIGGLSGSAPKVPMLKAEWGWGSPDPMADVLGAAITDTSGTTITATNGAYFQIGTIFRVDEEDFLVTNVSGATARGRHVPGGGRPAGCAAAVHVPVRRRRQPPRHRPSSVVPARWLPQSRRKGPGPRPDWERPASAPARWRPLQPAGLP